MKATLLGLAIIWLVITPTISGHANIDADSILGMWLFDDGNGDVATDASGNGNDGTLISNPKWVDGKTGMGLEFEFGANSYVIAPLPHSNTVTVALWALFTALPTNNSGLVHFQADEQAGGNPDSKIIGMWVENTGLLWGRFIPDGGGNVNMPKVESLDADTWYHIAMTIDEQGKKGIQWLNGEPVSEMDYPGELTQFAFIKIGRQGTESWTGILDEVIVLDQALTGDDLKNLMNGIESALGLEPGGKLTTLWGKMKSR